MKILLRKYLPEMILAAIGLTFSFWLMFHTFSYYEGSMLIASKAWSDFASHVPLIRSFSFGDNWPPEYPIFPGEPIRYHFLFYWFVGFLESLGIRIDYALNVPSALSFFLLLSSIYLLAKHLFKSRLVGALSVVLFLFNGTFSFFEFFRAHPLSISTIQDIFTNTNFPSFGPYDGKTVSAFWNLNIYTNQRHLALPFSLLLFLVLSLLKAEDNKKRFSLVLIFLGVLFLTVLPFVHSSIFVMSTMVLGMLFIMLKTQRVPILTIVGLGVLFSLPRVLFLKETAGFTPILKVGYLAQDPVTFISFFKYWFLNLGLPFFLVPLGFFFAKRKQRKVLVAFLPIFLIGNLVQFTIEMAGNHKFFNVFLAVGNILTAFVVFKMWKSNIFGKLIALILLLFLTLSGVIDFFAVKNDASYSIADYPKNEDVYWIKENTPTNAVFLNSTYLYNPASLAGRKIFLGWPYFSWSLGYDTTTRDKELKALLNPSDLEMFCAIANKNEIQYSLLDLTDLNLDFEINHEFFKNKFKRVYSNEKSKLLIYENASVCN